MHGARLLSVALMAVTLAFPGVTDASPRVRLTVRGACPSPLQVRAAFAVENVPVAADPHAAWQVRVEADANGAVLRMARTDGTARQERHIRSNDCLALAEAFALITAAHLRSSVPPLSSGSARPGDAARDSAPSLAPQPPIDSRAPGATAHVPASPGQTPRMTWAIGYALGYDSTLAPNTNGLFHRTHVAVTRPDRWGAVVSFRRATARDARMNETLPLERTETSAALLLTRMVSRDRLWLTPGAGAGLAMSWVEDANLAMVRRLHPTIDGGVAGGIRIAPWMSLRGEVSGQLFPVADTYSTSRDGVLGESPRATISVGVGIQLSPRGW